ncbi:MAG: AbfB domain-containing protein [Gallionella sp.]|nr:AbfB domain-containing protein [Gallionella sp.]
MIKTSASSPLSPTSISALLHRPFTTLGRMCLVLVATCGLFFSGVTHARANIGDIVQLKSVNYTDRYVRHRNYMGELTPVASDGDKKDASFITRSGLAGMGVSFESVNFPGYFLRHQNFEIKLHQREESDLYKKDATFIDERGLAGKGRSFESVNFPGFYLRHCDFRMFIDNNRHGNAACNPSESVFEADVSFDVIGMRDQDKTIQMRSVNYTDRYVRHRNYLGELTPVASDGDKKDASFITRPGLAGTGVSFESVNYPGYFLRHQNFEIKLHQREESDLYKKDATFIDERGLAGKGRSFESVNFPGFYLRHCEFRMFIDNNRHGNAACNPSESVFKADVSFEIMSESAQP